MTDVDDIRGFIAAQKRKIQQERSELVSDNVGRRDNIGYQRPASPNITQNNTTSVKRPEQPKAVVPASSDSGSPRGLAFGAYEDVQERLKKERAEEYKKFLAQKNYRSTGTKSPREKPVEKPQLRSALRNKEESPRDFPEDHRTSVNTVRNRQQDGQLDGMSREPHRQRGDKTYNELYDAYEELLARKRMDERRYRGLNDDPYSDPSRHVRFDEQSRLGKLYMDTWLDGSQRSRWELPPSDTTAGRQTDQRKRWDLEDRSYGGKQQDDSQKTVAPVKHETPDRLSRSAPSQAVPVFGEHDVTPEVKHERQAKYREELQAQMKERQMAKKRERNNVFVLDQHKEEKTHQVSSNPNTAGNQVRQPRQPDQPAQQLGRLNQQQPPYYNPYLQQPAYNYPTLGLPAGAGLAAPSLNPAGGLLGGYPMSYREPLGGYQPSWANGPLQQTQRMGGMGVGLGESEPRRELSALNRMTGGGGVYDNGGGYGSGGYGGSGGGGYGSGGGGYGGGGSGGGVVASKYGDFGEHVGVLPYHETKDNNQDRSRQQSYRDELARQMAEKEQRKKQDKEAAERYQMKLEKEIAEYDPWGRAGGGAPIKDVSGKLVSDLRQMHQYNKEGTIISPRDRKNKPDLATQLDNLDKEKTAGDTAMRSVTAAKTELGQQFQPMSIQTDDPQKKARLEYQEFLRLQVEEKQRKKKEEEDKLREINEREDKIIMEQQVRLKEEYNKEMEATKKKEEAARQKNDEIRHAAEQKKKEVEQKRLEEDMKQEDRLRKQLDERLKAATGKTQRSGSPPLPTMQDQQRSNSPPIPTLQNKQRSQSPPIPTLQNQPRSNSLPIPTVQKKFDRVVSEDDTQPRQTSRPGSNSSRDRRQAERRRTPSVPSTPVTQHNQESSRRRVPSATADIDVLSQLTSLRRQLKNEEIKVQQQLSENQEKYVQLRENSGTRRTKKPVSNVFDNVLRRTPAASQRDIDGKSYKAMNDFNKLKYEDTSSLHGDFISRYPDPATTESTLDLQQQSLLKEQRRRLQMFRDRASASANDKENVELLGNRTRPSSKSSQLESDSQFVSVDDPSKVLLEQGESSKPPPPALASARERRRWKQMGDLMRNSKLPGYKPATPGGSSLNSVTSFNVDEIAQKNEERLRRLESLKQARSSENNNDPNEVLKKFIQKHSRTDSKLSGTEESLPGDRKHIPGNVPPT